MEEFPARKSDVTGDFEKKRLITGWMKKVVPRTISHVKTQAKTTFPKKSIRW